MGGAAAQVYPEEVLWMLCLDEDEWAEPRPKSILKKFCWMLCLDEDEWADPRPKSILKSSVDVIFR